LKMVQGYDHDIHQMDQQDKYNHDLATDEPWWIEPFPDWAVLRREYPPATSVHLGVVILRVNIAVETCLPETQSHEITVDICVAF